LTNRRKKLDGLFFRIRPLPHRQALTEAATSTEKTCLKIAPPVAPYHRVTNPAWIPTFFSGILNGSEIAEHSAERYFSP
jgi:hypothetical protein